MVLLFIYNANSGKLNSIFHAGHKFFSPSTYACSLCALTFDTFTENTIWKTFRKESDIAMEFYHKDEFEAKFPKLKIPYPAIIKFEANKQSVILDSIALNTISNVEELIIQLKTKL